MSILNTFKSMVGSGAPSMEVTLKATSAAVQEAVKGSIKITGGDYNSDVDRIIFYMVTEEWIKDKDKKREEDSRLCVISFNDYTLTPGEVIEVPFQVRVPKSNLLSSEAIKNFIKAKLDIPGKDVWGMAEIKVV